MYAYPFAFKQKRILSEFSQKYGNYLVLYGCFCCCYSKHNLKLTKQWRVCSQLEKLDESIRSPLRMSNKPKHTLHVHHFGTFDGVKSGLGMGMGMGMRWHVFKIMPHTKVEMSLYSIISIGNNGIEIIIQPQNYTHTHIKSLLGTIKTKSQASFSWVHTSTRTLTLKWHKCGRISMLFKLTLTPGQITHCVHVLVYVCVSSFVSNWQSFYIWEIL